MKYNSLTKTISSLSVLLCGLSIVCMNAQESPVELLQNGNFKSGTDSWILETRGGTDAEMSVVDKGNDGESTLIVKVNDSQIKEPWKVQLSQRGMLLKAGKRYRMSLCVKCSEPNQCNVAFGHTTAPYDIVKGGEGQAIRAKAEWQNFSFEFSPIEDEMQVRLIITNLNHSGVEWGFSKLSLVELQ